ncbi:MULTISPECIES: hypothetical protein [Stenotrophomonas]
MAAVAVVVIRLASNRQRVDFMK